MLHDSVAGGDFGAGSVAEAAGVLVPAVCQEGEWQGCLVERPEGLKDATELALPQSSSSPVFLESFGAGMEAWCPFSGLVTLIMRFLKCQGGI